MKIRNYLVLITLSAVFICGTEWLYERFSGNTHLFPIYKMLYMFMPALSVFIIGKWRLRSIFREYRIGFKGIVVSKTLKFLFYTAVLLPLFILLFSWLLGNLLHLTDFGKLITAPEELNPLVATTLPPFFAETATRLSIGIPFLIVSSLLAGITLNLVFALGEEIGWRGFLEKNLKMTGALKCIVIGVIWGLWHAPLILMGHNYGEHHVTGILTIIAVCIVMSFFLSEGLHQSQSLLVPAAMHGIINSFSQTFSGDIFIKTGNPLLGAPMGVVFILSVVLVLLIDRAVRHKKPKETLS